METPEWPDSHNFPGWSGKNVSSPKAQNWQIYAICSLFKQFARAYILQNFDKKKCKFRILIVREITLLYLLTTTLKNSFKKIVTLEWFTFNLQMETAETNRRTFVHCTAWIPHISATHYSDRFMSFCFQGFSEMIWEGKFYAVQISKAHKNTLVKSLHS